MHASRYRDHHLACKYIALTRVLRIYFFGSIIGREGDVVVDDVCGTAGRWI
jgi:hypothetical protein